MTYGIDTWPSSAEHIGRLEQKEMTILLWMCVVSLRSKVASVELSERM